MDDVIETRELHGAQIGVVNVQARRAAQEDTFFITAAAGRKSTDIPSLLRSAFEDTANKTSAAETSGATATVAVISPDRIISIAHLGDAPAVLFVRDHQTGHVTAHDLIKPHKGSDPAERDRVMAAGGEMGSDGVGIRGSGPYEGRNVVVSRAFGDKYFKGVSAVPAMTQIDLSRYAKPDDQAFLCVCSDGLYTEFAGVTSEDYAALIETTLNSAHAPKQPHDIALSMAKLSYKEGSGDNLTALLVEVPKNATHDLVLGVLDGHGGRQVVDIATQNLQDLLGTQVAAARSNASPTR